MGIFSKVSKAIKHHVSRAKSNITHAAKRLAKGDTTAAKRLFDDGLHSVKRLHNNISKNEIVGSLYRGGVGNTIGKAIDGVESKRYMIDHAGDIAKSQMNVLKDIKSGNLSSALKGQGEIIAKLDSGGKAGNLKDLAKQKAMGVIDSGYDKATKFIPDSVKKEIGAMSASEIATRLGKTETGRQIRSKITQRMRKTGMKAMEKVDI